MGVRDQNNLPMYLNIMHKFIHKTSAFFWWVDPGWQLSSTQSLTCPAPPGPAPLP